MVRKVRTLGDHNLKGALGVLALGDNQRNEKGLGCTRLSSTSRRDNT